MEKLFSYIKETLHSAVVDTDGLDLYFENINIPKNQLLLDFNQVCRHYYFLKKGVLRIYSINAGKEHTCWFAFENYFFTEPESYLNATFSRFCFVATEDCELLAVSKSGMSVLAERYRWWNDFLLITQQQLIVKLVNVIRSFQSHSAGERYNDLFNHPEFIQRTSQKDLSTMIGITRHSLSRIRKNRK